MELFSRAWNNGYEQEDDDGDIELREVSVARRSEAHRQSIVLVKAPADTEDKDESVRDIYYCCDLCKYSGQKNASCWWCPRLTKHFPIFGPNFETSRDRTFAFVFLLAGIGLFAYYFSTLIQTYQSNQSNPSISITKQVSQTLAPSLRLCTYANYTIVAGFIGTRQSTGNLTMEWNIDPRVGRTFEDISKDNSIWRGASSVPHPKDVSTNRFLAPNTNCLWMNVEQDFVMQSTQDSLVLFLVAAWPAGLAETLNLGSQIAKMDVLPMSASLFDAANADANYFDLNSGQKTSLVMGNRYEIYLDHQEFVSLDGRRTITYGTDIVPVGQLGINASQAREYMNAGQDDTLQLMELTLRQKDSWKTVSEEQTTYGFFNLLSDIGGALGIFTSVVAFMFPEKRASVRQNRLAYILDVAEETATRFVPHFVPRRNSISSSNTNTNKMDDEFKEQEQEQQEERSASYSHDGHDKKDNNNNNNNNNTNNNNNNNNNNYNNNSNNNRQHESIEDDDESDNRTRLRPSRQIQSDADSI